MVNQTIGGVVKEKINSHLTTLKRNQALQSNQWETERNQLLEKCLLSVNKFETVIAEAMKMLRPLFEDKDAKDELFKFFFGNGYRIGRYFLLPIFSLVENNKFDSKKGKILAFAWDICNGMPCFRIITDVSDSSGEGESVTCNFFYKYWIKEVKEEFLKSNRKDKERMLSYVNDWNEDHARFLELLQRSNIFSSTETFLDRVISLYSSELTKEEVKNITYSMRCREKLIPGEGNLKYCTPAIMGENKFAEKNTKELSEALLDMGYPDKQKIVIDLEEYFTDEDAPAKLRTKTVGYVREQWRSWNRKGDPFAEEISNYGMYIISD